MSDVVGLHSSTTVLWSPPDARPTPIRGALQLEAVVSGFRAYGQSARIYQRSGDGREAFVTALGGDGWLVRVRDSGMVRGGWPCSSIVTRRSTDGSIPTALTGSQWYRPDEASDLAGCLHYAEQIQFAPTVVSQSAWSWIIGEPMPSGYASGKPRHDLVVCGSVAEGFSWIADAGEAPWPAEGVEAALDLVRDFDIDRVVVTSPGQVTVRLRKGGRRIRFQHRGRSEEAHVLVVGMVDELGHEFTMRLPGREIVRIRRGRAAQ